MVPESQGSGSKTSLWCGQFKRWTGLKVDSLRGGQGHVMKQGKRPETMLMSRGSSHLHETVEGSLQVQLQQVAQDWQWFWSWGTFPVLV